jgi:hypothetical protein
VWVNGTTGTMWILLNTTQHHVTMIQFQVSFSSFTRYCTVTASHLSRNYARRVAGPVPSSFRFKAVVLRDRFQLPARTGGVGECGIRIRGLQAYRYLGTVGSRDRLGLGVVRVSPVLKDRHRRSPKKKGGPYGKITLTLS